MVYLFASMWGSIRIESRDRVYLFLYPATKVQVDLFRWFVVSHTLIREAVGRRFLAQIVLEIACGINHTSTCLIRPCGNMC